MNNKKGVGLQAGALLYHALFADGPQSRNACRRIPLKA